MNLHLINNFIHSIRIQQEKERTNYRHKDDNIVSEIKNNEEETYTMKNRLYLTEKDSPTFSDWFTDAYLANNPNIQNKVTCKNVTIVITEDCNFACTYC